MKHLWVAIVTYDLTEDDAERAHQEGKGFVFLDEHNRKEILIGCYRCELEWKEVHDKPCKGDSYPYINPGARR